MPFVIAKTSVPVSDEQATEIKTRLGNRGQQKNARRRSARVFYARLG